MSEKRISFTISDKAHKALRHLAADRESSQQAVIEDLILTAGAKWVAEQTDAGHVADADNMDARR